VGGGLLIGDLTCLAKIHFGFVQLGRVRPVHGSVLYGLPSLGAQCHIGGRCAPGIDKVGMMPAYEVCSQVSGVRSPAGSSIHGALKCKCLTGYQV
jgi:hypothetical protein